MSGPEDPEPFTGSILIADDHAVYRYGLALVLREGLGAQKILHAEHFEEALRLLDQPDLKLGIFDLGMPGLAQARSLEVVRRHRPDLRVVVLSASETREDILSALAAGVHGYLLKSATTDALIGQLRSVLSGEIYVPPLIAHLAAGITEAAQGPKNSVLPKLSQRQRQVLRGLVEGRSNKEIAQALELSEGTVKMHIAALLRQIGAANRTHAAALGKELLG
jgi:DNA-binding NarL/FixJ family response regulator